MREIVKPFLYAILEHMRYLSVIYLEKEVIQLLFYICCCVFT